MTGLTVVIFSDQVRLKLAYSAMKMSGILTSSKFCKNIIFANRCFLIIRNLKSWQRKVGR